MGKFRNKLKGRSKGKRWQKGQCSSSNPETKKHRDLAKSRFFQENLGNSNLTQNALKKHDAIQALSPTKKPSTDMNDDTEVESTIASTYQTMNSFASEWSHCSNMSFNRFLKIFRSDSALHKEMLAVLAAITEVIKESGGSETPTEYYCSLLTTLEQVMSGDKNEDQITAVLSLLNMGIKTVPDGVLRKGFGDVAKRMLDILNEFSRVENNVIVKSIFGILTALLKVQESAVWTLSSTNQLFGVLLDPFCIHTKPKWRKAAQQAVIEIVRTGCFVKDNSSNPAAEKVAEFCDTTLNKSFEGNLTTLSIKAGQTTILHVLGLLKDTISSFSKSQMKKSCEVILRLMTLNYPIVTSCSLQVLHSLFNHQSAVVPAKLNGQLISALYEYQPAVTDVQPTLAWLTVMQQAHVHLADVDHTVACAALPRIFSTFTQLWLSEKMEITTSVTHALDRLLRDAIAPACETSELVIQHKSKLVKCFNIIELGLGYQYNKIWNQVLHVIGVMFEVAGKNCSHLLLGCLKSLAELRDSYKFSYNAEVEHAIGAAVRSMGPEIVLSVINLKNDNDELNIDRSWLLLVLKENVKECTLEFWAKTILPLAIFCQKQSFQHSAMNDGIAAHSYELFYLQLWNLLPSFCNKPTDIKTSFKDIAKILGTAMSNNKELQLSIMASLRKLIGHAKECEDTEHLSEIARFDKNYLPILFNLYTIKPNGTDEEGQRLAALDTIKVFLSIAKPELTKQLFENALERLKTTEDTDQSNLFTKESVLDLVRALVPYQSVECLDELYQQCIKILPEIKNKKEQKKAYRLLEEICGSDSANCKAFLKNNRKVIQKLLTKTLESAAVTSKGARLRCLNYLVKAQPHLTHESVLLRAIVPEAVLCLKDINEKCRLSASDLLNTIGETLLKHNEMQQFVAILAAGFAGTTQMISASILALTTVLHNFSGALGNENIQFLMENIGNIITCPTREIVGSCLSFIKTFCTSLPSPLVCASLPNIMKALTSMTEDCKRHFRLKIRDILDRLVRKYGCESITPHIPTSDTVMYKKLRNLRKLNARKNRHKEASKEHESASEDEFVIAAKPKSIEEILADSDLEDLENDSEPHKPNKTNKKQTNTWIQEDPDTIVDFTDPKVTSKITATKPHTRSVELPQKKNKDRGFKTASDGRLLIEDSSDSDSDVKSKRLEHLKLEDSDSDKDEASTVVVSQRKRKRSVAGSIKSNLSSQPAMKYQAGGSGIHRPVAQKTPGSQYKAKKAGGDIKKKGKVEPYAYLPLQRNALNKRKRAKMSSQFKSFGKAARSGAKKGMKAKKKMKVELKQK